MIKNNRLPEKYKSVISRCSVLLILSAVFSVLLISCTQAGETASETREVFAMDTYMTLTVYGEDADAALDQAENEIYALDALLSTGLADSEISVLNQKGSAILSDAASYLMTRSIEVSQMTDGAFNPLIYPLMEIWGFTDSNYRVPDSSEITSLLPLLNLQQVSFRSETREISFETEGMKIDFGGIAKGYTSSEIMKLFSACGIQSAVVSLGGNVQTLGHKPDGSLWKVAIIDPANDGSYLGILQTADKAVITSGGYERYFEQDGKIWHHILDPATGYPASSGLLSVTIISSDGTLADGLSTALFVQGLEKAEETWRDNAGIFDAVFFTESEELYVTEGIADYFSSSLYPVHIIYAK